jgi:hypothetical protein
MKALVIVWCTLVCLMTTPEITMLRTPPDSPCKTLAPHLRGYSMKPLTSTHTVELGNQIRHLFPGKNWRHRAGGRPVVTRSRTGAGEGMSLGVTPVCLKGLF